MTNIIPIERIESKIYYIRGQKVMQNRDLAELYKVTTSTLKRQVRRNIKRFPDDFMFELSKEEYDSLRCQFGALKRGGHSKYLPFAFTEQGIAMLSGILNSDLAINVNIQIMRTFTKLRQMLADNEQLKRKIEQIERKYDSQFKVVFKAIKELVDKEKKVPRKRRIGFITEK